ncbi:hypothetical protein I6A84_44435, partial [Frankia sp. CNm7]|nr:hypothetical protein [Frankia nepalensis]
MPDDATATRLRIVLAEDAAIFREGLARLLAPPGPAVVAAGGAAPARGRAGGAA